MNASNNNKARFKVHTHFSDVLLRTRSSELGVFYFFENLRTQNEEHDLKGPHVALAFVAFSREVVEEFK